MEHWLDRTEMILGKEKIVYLEKKHVAIFGIGGVGSYTCEALVRSGVGEITIIDKDVIDITNINRQLLADTSCIGKSKVEVAKERYLKINPNIILHTHPCFYEKSTSNKLIPQSCDYIIDAIDTVTSKLSLIEEAKKRNIPILSCMGTGNKLDPTKFQIVDISKTSVCPLAKVMRKELKIRGIENVKVLFSTEEPIKTNSRTPGSISFVPSIAGLLLASEIIKDLIH